MCRLSHVAQMSWGAGGVDSALLWLSGDQQWLAVRTISAKTCKENAGVAENGFENSRTWTCAFAFRLRHEVVFVAVHARVCELDAFVRVCVVGEAR
jgi:hypothetical protein